MIDLKKITRGKSQRPPRVVIYSAEGLGKTKFASGAPKPFFLDFDRGSGAYDVERATPETWSETKEWVSSSGPILTGSVQCDTVVLDSVSVLEGLCFKEIFAGTTIGEYAGGFNKGEDYAVMVMREFVSDLERMWLRGKGVVLVAHAVTKKFDDPTGPGYERFEVGMRPRLAGILKQWADYVFFAREEVLVVTDKKGAQARTRATTSGTRWAYTRRCPAYDAKARGTLLFPERFLLSWDEFAKAISSESERLTEMTQGIEEMLAELADAELTKTVRDFVRKNPDRIVGASQSLQARLEAKRAADKPAETTSTAAPNGS